jgi:hypothetical protein
MSGPGRAVFGERPLEQDPEKTSQGWFRARSTALCRRRPLSDVFLRLPYEILIPNTLFEEELIKFTIEEKEALVRGGLQVVDLPGEGVLRTQEVVGALPHLSIHDGFAFALAAEPMSGVCILRYQTHH